MLRIIQCECRVVKSQAGFLPDLNEQLKNEAGIDSLPESKRYVALLIDEMKIKDLVYDKRSGQIVGFTSLGDIGDMSEMEQQCAKGSLYLIMC